MADRGELDAEEAEELFDRLGVKLSLTTTYIPDACHEYISIMASLGLEPNTL